MTIKTGAMIAATVATMFTGFVGCGSDTEEQKQGLRCEGSNLCKGMGECKVAGKNECTGMNTCAGTGYTTTKTQAECDQKQTAAKAEAAKVAAAKK